MKLFDQNKSDYFENIQYIYVVAYIVSVSLALSLHLILMFPIKLRDHVICISSHLHIPN